MVTVADIVERVVEGETPPKLFAEHKARYEFAARFARGQRVLDVACGTGFGTPVLRAGGAAEVIGMDLDEGAVDYAQARYGRSGVSFLQGDVCDPPPLGQFDLIASFETIEHLDDPVSMLAACARLLRPAGVLLVSTPYRYRMNPDGSPLNPFHKREWRTDEFAAFLRPHFPDVTMYGQGIKLQKKRLVPLSRQVGVQLSRFQGVRAGDSSAVYRLPGPRLFGLWDSFPGYVVAVCRTS